ncbi:MAG: magnesium transporter, partial [Desulfurococcaceae archaeon]
IMGIPMAAAGFIFSLLIAWLEVEVAVAVSLSLFIVVSLINIVGSLLPIIATKIGIDPAVLSGPLITTIADVVGIGIYLAIAYYILVI